MSQPRLKLKPVAGVQKADLPPRFTADYCLRCLRFFKHLEPCRLVLGSESARYREVALTICQDCIASPPRDRLLPFFSLYVAGASRRPSDTHIWKPGDPNWKPGYMTTRPLEGFAKLNRIPDGRWHIGLHRGHVEIWSQREIETIGGGPTDGSLGYSEDFGMYGSMELMGPKAHPVVECQFAPLDKDWCEGWTLRDPLRFEGGFQA